MESIRNSKRFQNLWKIKGQYFNEDIDNTDTNLNDFSHNSLTELIVFIIMLALYLNIQIYELRLYLLIHFHLLKFRMFDSKIK